MIFLIHQSHIRVGATDGREEEKSRWPRCVRTPGETGDGERRGRERGDGVEIRRTFFHLFVVMKSHATSGLLGDSGTGPDGNRG
jgi:hypothetical protein